MRFTRDALCVTVSLLAGTDIVLGKYGIGGATTGINSATGERPARRDITEMVTDIPTFSLYIQALQAMHANVETSGTSWFQVAGIHGRPYIPWEGVPNTPGAPKIGYCTHSNALFVSWHRPYLALYEQILSKYTRMIAAGYNSAVYTQAAERFRIPYWDWAAPPFGMPAFFSSENITITTASGVKSVVNPLATYKFKRFPYSDATFPSSNSLSSYPQTVRRPRNRVSDPAAVNAKLNSDGPTIARQLYTVFSRSTAYNTMATSSTGGASFEQPHGWLHITVGGNGHMTDVGFSAFDPIFVLHHTNVDRLSVMWQAIYPDSYLTPTTLGGGGSWTLVPGQNIDGNTPLLPFYRPDGRTPWNTNTARFAKTFGYSYPEVQDWAFTGADAASQLKANVTARVNQLYNSASKKRSVIRDRSLEARQGSIPDREWSISLSAPNGALNGESYTVYLFLQSTPTDTFTWLAQSIGFLAVLAQPLQNAATLPSKTEVVITDYLQDKGVDTKDVAATKKYIDNNLVWAVQKADDTVVDNASFKGLTILVEDEVVKFAKNEESLPVYLNKTLHPDVTPINPVIPL